MTGFYFVSLLAAVSFALAGGRESELAQSVGEGAQSGVEVCLSMLGMLCLWCGVMKVLERSGGVRRMKQLLRPLLSRLYPETFQLEGVLENVSANASANLLGIGNAATPPGIAAARRMAAFYGGTAGRDLCTLVICNTASIQLLPTTAAALRAGAGCDTPMDILPAVWLASAGALAVGLFTARILNRVWP